MAYSIGPILDPWTILVFICV